MKFNPFAQEPDRLADRKGVEVVSSDFIKLLHAEFLCAKVNVEAHVENRQLSDLVLNGGYRIARKQINKINAIAARFRYFVPFGDIFEEAEETRSWFHCMHNLEKAGFFLPKLLRAREGVNNVVSLQPFGCIASPYCCKRNRKTC